MKTKGKKKKPQPTQPASEPVNSFTAPTAWSDISAEEKVERTREILKHALRRIEEQNTRLHEFEELLQRHTHNERGEPAVPMFTARGFGLPHNIGSTSVGNSESTYF